MSGHPYIAIPEIRGGVIHVEECRRITDVQLAEWTRRTKPQIGDVVVTRRGRVGDSAPIPVADAAIGQNLVILRSDSEQVDQEFLRWAVRSPQWWEEVDRWRNVGAVFSSLNVRDISRIRVPVPPLPTQRAIAEVLGALDDKIAANEGLARAVDGLCEALFDRFAALPRTTLASIAVVNDQSLKPGHGGVRYLDIRSVSVGGYAWPDVIDWAEAPSRARRLVKPGDTVWSTVRPNRRSHALVLDSGLVGSTGLAVITPSSAGPAFVYQATKTPEFTSYLEGVAEGSAYPAVRAERFLDAPIPQVDPGRRSWFEESAYAMRQRVHATAQESRYLAELRDTLLPHLMSGRLTVRQAEKQVEEVL